MSDEQAEEWKTVGENNKSTGKFFYWVVKRNYLNIVLFEE